MGTPIRYSRALLFVICWTIYVLVAGSAAQESERFKRYDQPTGYYRIREDLVSLHDKVQENSLVGIRVCSSNDIANDLFSSNADPLYILNLLTGDLGVSPHRIYLLFSSKCRSNSELIEVEIWTSSRIRKFPASEKLIVASSLRFEPAGEQIFKKGMRDYSDSIDDLVERFAKDPSIYVVLRGFYINEPSALLSKRIEEIFSTLRSRGIPGSRIICKVNFWPDEVSSDPADNAEPTYPDVYILKIGSE